jgi:hypothetical protein
MIIHAMLDVVKKMDKERLVSDCKQFVIFFLSFISLMICMCIS